MCLEYAVRLAYCWLPFITFLFAGEGRVFSTLHAKFWSQLQQYFLVMLPTRKHKITGLCPIAGSITIPGASSGRGTWNGCSFARGPEGKERKAMTTGISLHGGSVGQPGVGSSTRDFELCLKGHLKVGRLSLWDLCERNLEGGLSSWGP